MKRLAIELGGYLAVDSTDAWVMTECEGYGIAYTLQTLHISFALQVYIVFDLAMHGLPTADNNSIAESKSKDYRKTPAFFEVLHLVVDMCNSCSSEFVGRLEEHNNKGTVGSLGSSEDTDTGTVQFKVYIYIHIHAIMSCPLFTACSSSLCCTTCLSRT